MLLSHILKEVRVVGATSSIAIHINQKGSRHLSGWIFDGSQCESFVLLVRHVIVKVSDYGERLSDYLLVSCELVR